MTDGTLPYGPETAAARRFLAQLAGLGAADRTRVVERYTTVSVTRAWAVAEQTMAEAIERAGRDGYRDAIAGPLLQLVRRPDAPPPTTDDEAVAALEPIAEPALAALLALLVRDLVSDAVVRTLTGPFDEVVGPPAA